MPPNPKLSTGTYTAPADTTITIEQPKRLACPIRFPLPMSGGANRLAAHCRMAKAKHMHKSKPISILKNFDAKEMNRFGQFVNSPYFNSNENLVRLYGICKAAHPHFEGEALHRERLFATLFPDLPYREQKLRYLFSDFTKLLERYLIQECFGPDKRQALGYLLKSYVARGETERYAQAAGEWRRFMKRNPRRDVEHYLQCFRFAECNLQMHGTRNRDQNVVAEIYDNLDVFYVANYLKYSCEFFNNRNVFATNLGPPVLPQNFADGMEAGKYGGVPAIVIYHQILKTLHQPDEEGNYPRLLSLLKEHALCFGRAELYDMYIYARNYCIRKINMGQGAYIQKLFDLYAMLIDGEVLLRNDRISEWDYKNIVQISLRLGKVDYAEKFIETYRHCLPPENRVNAANYNLACVYFARGKYGKTFELLQQVAFTDPYYHMGTNLLLMKSYYESGEIMPLFNLADTVKVYVQRNRLISETNKGVYLNFVSLVKQLGRLKNGGKKSLATVKRELASNPSMLEVGWLREKIGELEKKRRS